MVFLQLQKKELHFLATLCPGTNGTAVYQAIALYNALYNQIINPSCNEVSGDRKIKSAKSLDNSHLADFQLFPNPANETVIFKASLEMDQLNITIKDLSGRIVLNRKVQVMDFIATLDIDLVNGAYLILIVNSHNERQVKKLLISK